MSTGRDEKSPGTGCGGQAGYGDSSAPGGHSQRCLFRVGSEGCRGFNGRKGAGSRTAFLLQAQSNQGPPRTKQTPAQPEEAKTGVAPFVARLCAPGRTSREQ